MRLIKNLQITNTSMAVSLVRILLGWLLFTEGSGKLWGWFDGQGIQTTQMFYKQLHVPFSPYNAYVIGVTQLVCGVLLLAGFMTRIVIIPVTALMIGSIYLIASLSGHYDQGHLIFFTLCLVLMRLGAGPLSIDRAMTNSKSKE